MPIPRTSTICARIPDEVKEGLVMIATHFDMSISDVVVRFCRDGIQKYKGISSYEMLENLKPKALTQGK